MKNKFKYIFLLFFIITSINVYGQKDIFFYELDATAFRDLTLKKGKKPKTKSLNLKIYTLVYEEPKRYNTGKHIQFTLYIEKYKKEIIKELFFDTNIRTGRRLNRIKLNKEEIISTFKSNTDIDKICCSFQDHAYTFKKSNLRISKILKNNSFKLPISTGNFYNQINKDEFVSFLKKKGIDSKSISYFLKVKDYADRQFGDRGKYETLINELEEQNGKLKYQLKKWIPNYNIQSRNNHQINSHNYNYNGIYFNYIMETFKWKSEFKMKDDRSYESRSFYQLTIKYPKNHEFEGIVYLKSNRDITKNNGYLEVYKSETKKPIPYKRLMIDYYRSNLDNLLVFNLNGKLNNSFNTIKNQKEFIKAFSSKNKSKDYIKSNKVNDVDSRLKGTRILNEYLNKILVERKKQFNNYYTTKRNEKEESILKTIKEYNRQKKNSITKNGFHLNTRDFDNNKEDSEINFMLQYIYNGDFHKLRSFNRDNDFQLSVILNHYMRKKAKICGTTGINSKDIVPIYDNVCAEEMVTKDGFGTVTRRNCTRWVREKTGLYASRRLYSLQKSLEAKTDKEALSLVFSLVFKRGDMSNKLKNAFELKKDLDKLFKLNNCSSKALKRFENNLVRFITDDDPLEINKPIDNRKVNYKVEQDFLSIVEDLIRTSKGFGNTISYIPNSLSELIIYENKSKKLSIQKSYLGKPYKIEGKFKWLTAYKEERDADIEIEFNKKGSIRCIHLWKVYNSECIKPNGKIISDLKAGKYIDRK